MAKHIIRCSLSSSSIRQAIRQLQAREEWISQKTQELTERLAVLGAREASVRYAAAMYDGENDAAVSVDATPNGYVIRVTGNAAFFIEFGAGVYYNTGDPYPGGRPPGVAPIGEYGQGKGKRDTWGYYDEGDNLVLTHGNPAAMPMYYATVEMERSIRAIAQEVFA